MNERLDALENAIQRWDPALPENAMHICTVLEIEIIKLQARAYRYAALLVIHRLRFSFGLQDERALLLSEAIFSAMEKMYCCSQSAGANDGGIDASEVTTTSVQFEYRLEFPFLTAAMEIDNAVEGGAHCRSCRVSSVPRCTRTRQPC